jgi:amidohydrolase
MTPNLHEATAEVVPHVLELRRHFHRNPETGLDLPNTAKRVEKELDTLGIPHQRCIEHGVIGMLDSGQPGPTVMLRADMDALNVAEENTHEYISTIPGKMHACGHDSHTAMLIGAATVLKHAGISRGRIKLLFQPGEEGAHGAELMIADGAMMNPKVDYCYGQHIWAMTPVGTIQVEDGPIMAAVDTVYFTIEGKGTHAAQPDTGHDPIVCAAQIVSALQTIATRNVDPLQSCVITVSMFNAGTAHNVIPQRAKLAISVRVFDDEVHNLIERRIKEIINGISASMGCTAEIDYLREHQPTINAPEIAALVREEAAAIVGKDSVWNHGQKTMGAEDMSDFLRLAPGAFAFVGGRNAAKGCDFPHHHPKFNFDEDGLALGTELMYRVGQRLLQL